MRRARSPLDRSSRRMSQGGTAWADALATARNCSVAEQGAYVGRRRELSSMAATRTLRALKVGDADRDEHGRESNGIAHVDGQQLLPRERFPSSKVACLVVQPSRLFHAGSLSAACRQGLAEAERIAIGVGSGHVERRPVRGRNRRSTSSRNCLMPHFGPEPRGERRNVSRPFVAAEFDAASSG